jgi:hypothetical protein
MRNDDTPHVRLIDPGHAAGGDTVNHAELAAIYIAIKESHDSTHTIAADCMAALCQIRKAVHHQALIRIHLHAELLERIVQLLRQSQLIHGPPGTHLSQGAQWLRRE